MISTALKNKLERLSPDQQKKIEMEIDEWLKIQAESQTDDNNAAYRGYGSLKGKIWMSEDFNEPLDDFKDYL